MSNLSIITRLEQQIITLEKNPLLHEEFSEYLSNSIEALEGIPYKLIKEMGTFIYRVEVAGFAEEDDFISDFPEVIKDLRQWLKEIKEKYC